MALDENRKIRWRCMIRAKLAAGDQTGAELPQIKLHLDTCHFNDVMALEFVSV